MDEKTFQDKFSELLQKIQQLPEAQRGEMQEMADQSRERRERIQSAISELQESLDFLRLSVKYLVFDLEATRRENAYLRRLIEQSNRESQEQHRDHEQDDNFLGDEEPSDEE